MHAVADECDVTSLIIILATFDLTFAKICMGIPQILNTWPKAKNCTNQSRSLNFTFL